MRMRVMSDIVTSVDESYGYQLCHLDGAPLLTLVWLRR